MTDFEFRGCYALLHHCAQKIADGDVTYYPGFCFAQEQIAEELDRRAGITT